MLLSELIGKMLAAYQQYGDREVTLWPHPEDPNDWVLGLVGPDQGWITDLEQEIIQ
jgi:hypothetical protein